MLVVVNRDGCLGVTGVAMSGYETIVRSLGRYFTIKIFNTDRAMRPYLLLLAAYVVCSILLVPRKLIQNIPELSGYWFKQYLFTEKHICKYNTNGTGSDGKRNAYI